MDLLQVALVFLILLLSVFLTILGIQVFFILKDLHRSLDKLETILNDVQEPVAAVAEVAQVVEAGAGVVKEIITKKTESKPAKRLFKKR